MADRPDWLRPIGEAGPAAPAPAAPSEAPASSWLRPLAGGATAAPAPAPAPERSWALEDAALQTGSGGLGFDEAAPMPLDEQRRAELLAWRDKGTTLSPDAAAETLRIAAASGHPPEYVAEHLDELRGAYHARVGPPVDWQALARQQPALADFLTADPARFALVRDDVANLSGIAYALTGSFGGKEKVDFGGGATGEVPKYTPPFWIKIVGDALNQAEIGLLQTREYLRNVVSSEPLGSVPPDPATEARIAQLQRSVPAGRDYGIEDIRSTPLRLLARAIGWVGETTPLVGGTLAAAGAGGLAAGPAGAVLAPLAFNWLLGAGPEYAAKRQELKAAGKEGDPDAEEAALFWATLGGVVNAELGTAGVRGFAGLARRGAAAAAEEAAKTAIPKLLQDETVGRVLRRAALERGTEYAEGLATMVAMAAVSSMTQEKLRSDVTGEPFRWEVPGHAALEAGKEAALGLALLSATSTPVRRYTEELGRAVALERSAARLGKAIEAARSSKTIERAPAEAEAILQRVAAGTDAETVYLEKAEFDRLYQEKGVDPREVAATVLGDGGKAYDEASATGADLPVPAATFLAKLAKTPEGLALRDIARLPQDERTPRQMREEAVRVGKKIKEQAEAARAKGEPAPRDAIFDDFKAKAVAAGRSEVEAKMNAELVARSFTWFGAQTGRDPVELYRAELPLTVHGPGGPAAAPVEPAMARAAQRQPQGEARLPEGAVISIRGPSKGKGRGFFQVEYDAGGAPVRGEIHLVHPDRSTLPHELMHFFVDVMGRLVDRPGASVELKDGHQALLRAMGYADARERQVAGKERRELAAKEKRSPAEAARLKELTAREERVTHMWEQFLAEGKAPTKELLPVFARMKSWFGRIYRGVEGIQEQFRGTYGEDLQLTDEVRRTFNRMLAGDEAVSAAAAELEAQLPAVKLTPEEQAKSDQLRAEARATAEAEVQRLISTEERKADREYMTAERERVTNEVEAELDADPVYRAIGALRGVIDGAPGPLDREAVVKEFGAATADALPKGTVAKDGLPTEVAADFVGFPSGEALIRALVGAEDRPARVKRLVAERMRELYPALSERPRLLAEVAKGEMQNAAWLRDGVLRLRAMERELGLEPSAPSAASIAEAAQKMVRDLAYKDNRPDRWDLAARGAARRAAEAKDPRTRRDEFETYLLDRALYRAALEARDASEKITRQLAAYTRDSKRAELGKAVEKAPDGTVTQPYLDKVDALLDAFELRASASMKEVASREEQRAALEKWVNERWADGDAVIIPPSVMEKLGRTTHWKDLSLVELEDLKRAVDSIAQQADLRTKFDVGGQKVATERVIEELAAAAIANGGKVVERLTSNTATRGEKAKDIARQLKRMVERPEQLFHVLDGYDPNGPWTRYVWNRLSDAAYTYYDLVRSTSGPLHDYLRQLPAAERDRIRGTRFMVDGHEYTSENVIAVLANAGNDSNLSKMTRGMSDPRLRLFGLEPWQGRNTLDAILAHATKADVEHAQKIIDTIEMYWPKAERLEIEDTGLAPQKIQARPFTFKGAGGEVLTLRGGYYPIVYSSKLPVGKRQAEADVASAVGMPGVFNRNYEAGTTPQGYLQARLDTFARPFDLTLDALPRHLAKTSKDIAFRIPAKQLYRVLTDDRVVGALTQALGERGYNVVLSHLKDSVNDVMLPDAGAGIALKAMNKLRGLATESIFIGNVGQTLQNLADVVTVKQVVPVGEFRDAVLRIAGDREGVVARIVGESAEMRIRSDSHRDSVARQLEDTFRKSKLALKWEDAKALGMAPFEATNAFVEFPVYEGAKTHAMKAKEEGGLGLTEEQAIKHAEEAVRTAFGGKRTVDLPPIMRDKVLRWFTMFYGWANAQLGMFMRSAGIAQREWSAGRRTAALKTLGETYAEMWMKNVLSELLVGKGPEDKDQDGKVSAAEAAKWAAWRGVMAAPLTAPVIGSLIRAGSGTQARDVSLTPWTNLFNAGVKTWVATNRAIGDALEQGELDDDRATQAFMAWLEFGGGLTGAPTAQTMATARYWTDPNRNPGAPAGEKVLGTAFGPKRPGKLSTAIYGP